MMSNLFSIFDPSTTFGISFNWLSTFVGLIILPLGFWVTSNRYSIFVKKLLWSLHQEFMTLLGPNVKPGHTLMFITFFIFILFNNLFGLVPYIFTATSHLVVTLGISLPVWLAIMLYGWLNHTKHMLAVRLAANMIAGHLLLVLLGNQGPGASSAILGVLLVVQVLLLVLETAVAAIQSYVFAVLSTLYSSEVI